MLNTTAAATHNTILHLTIANLPRIGSAWPDQGGIFAGLVRGQEGAADYLLILGPERESELGWQAAIDWAAGLDIDGHRDFSLPTRAEQAVLFGNLRDQFESDWYWSCEQLAASADYAWRQLFGSGGQLYWLKGYDHRARAVRRLTIQ